MTSFWSESYISKKSALAEAYHRVCLEIDANDPKSLIQFCETFPSLANNYFLHLIFYFQASFDIQELIEALGQLYQSLSKPELIFDRLIVSISVPLSFISTYKAELQQLESIKCFKILFISIEGLIDSIYILEELQQLPLELYRSKGISLGLRDFASHDMIASFLEREAQHLDILHVIGASVQDLPNLHLQSVELCHRLGKLVLLSLPSSYFSCDSDSIFQRNLLQNYSSIVSMDSEEKEENTSLMVILLKAILQFGSVLSLPYPSNTSDLVVYVHILSRLSHPFVHRKKKHVSEFKVLSLTLSDDTMAAIEETSLRVEQEVDVKRAEMYSRVMPAPLELTFFAAETVTSSNAD